MESKRNAGKGMQQTKCVKNQFIVYFVSGNSRGKELNFFSTLVSFFENIGGGGSFVTPRPQIRLWLTFMNFNLTRISRMYLKQKNHEKKQTYIIGSWMGLD